MELYDAIWIRKEYMDAFPGGGDGSQCQETAERPEIILSKLQRSVSGGMHFC